MKHFFSLFAILALAGMSFAQLNRTIPDESLLAMEKIQTLKYRLVKKERIKGEMKKGEIQVKYHKKPFKVYIYVYDPKPGVEILYVQGENNNKAHVNPNNFLSVLDPNLDPMGKMLRKDEHHTILETGFEFSRNLLTNLRKRANDEDRYDEYCEYKGEVTWANRSCHKLLLTYPDFKWETYTVKKGESVIDIAKDRNLNEYMILEKNKLSWYDKVSEGQKIQIPNIYAPKVIIYIDKILKLPIYQEVHDEQGLFEIYEYHGLIVNPNIPSEEFTKKYKDYHF